MRTRPIPAKAQESRLTEHPYPAPQIAPAYIRERMHAAATIFQRLARGHLTRMKYKIEPLPSTERSTHTAFILGNDPKFTDLPENDFSKSVGLVATSGWRAITVACQIGYPIVTKTIVVDHSVFVQGLWRETVSYFELNQLMIHL